MRGKAVAWVAYLPVPGLALVPAWLAPGDRLARYHARQGGLLVVLLHAALLGLGLAGQAAPGAADVLAGVAATLLLAGLAGLAWGLVGAARGRYPRVRPAWDLCALLWR